MCRIDELKPELLESLSGLAPQRTSVALFSTVEGRAIDGTELTPAYWARNMREPVAFAAAIEALLEIKHDLFLEVGPHPVLSTPIFETARHAGHEISVVSSLRRDEPERAALLGSLGHLYSLGCEPAWPCVTGEAVNFVRLPHYPWQRERQWFQSEDLHRAGIERYSHPLLGRREDAVAPVWSARIDLRGRLSYLADHRLQNAVIFPGAGYVEMALAAARQVLGEPPWELESMELVRACLLPEDREHRLQVVLNPAQGSVEISSFPPEGGTVAVRHCGGTVRRASTSRPAPPLDFDAIRNRCATVLPTPQFYEGFRRLGYSYGPTFQRVEQLWLGDGEVLGAIALPAEIDPDAAEYILHPLLLDGCFQVLIAAVANRALAEEARLYLPSEIERMRVYRKPSDRIWAHGLIQHQSESGLKADLAIYDEGGDAVAEIQGFWCRPIAAAMGAASVRAQDHLFESRWEARPRFLAPADEGDPSWIPQIDKLMQELRPYAERMIKDCGRRRFLDELQPRVTEIAGCDFHEGATISLQKLTNRWNLPSHQQRMVHRLCEMLAEGGILAPQEGGWRVCAEPRLRDLSHVDATSWSLLSGYQAEMTLIQQCAPQVGPVLRGEVDPLEVLFPRGSFALTQWLFASSASYRLPNQIIQRALLHIVHQVPAGRSARVLELGGGTGGLTSHLAPVLASHRAQYVFTDVSQAFLAPAQEAFSHLPFVGYKELNLDVEPLSQGFPEHAFDLIVASEVLHATRDLRRTLAHIKSLLRPGGLLIAIEVSPAAMWVTATFGLLPSWWSYEDVTLRGSDPRLFGKAWQKLLKEEGFAEIETIEDHPDARRSLQTVLFAKGPAMGEPQRPPAAGAADAAAKTERADGWLLFADDAGFADALAKRLEAQGAQPIVVLPGVQYAHETDRRYRVQPENPEHAREVLSSALAANSRCHGVIHCWNLDAPSPDALANGDLDTAIDVGIISLLNVVQLLAKLPVPPQLIIVTRGAQPAGDPVPGVAIAQALAWGFGRVVANEHPALRCKLIDLDPIASENEFELMLEEIGSTDAEDEIAFRNGCRHVHRVARVPSDESRRVDNVEQETGLKRTCTLRAHAPSSGLLDGLRMRPAKRLRPQPGQVEIEVRAAGLNFKDLMVALGNLPPAALEGGHTGRALGIECAGTITALGEGVTGLALGEPVIACGPGTLATHTLVDARFVFPKPDHLTFEEGSTILCAFSTACYALYELARLRPGERILIHAAAGGVGLAAIQVARQLGAEIYATAGSKEKRDFLHTLGVRHVSDSRSLAFAEDIRAWTGGAGVDVVLNSLGGDALAVGVGLLAPYGRFVEIGKLDIYANNRLGLRAFRNNLSFFAVDIDRLLVERADFAGSLSHKILEQFQDRRLFPLPHRVFPSARLADAFRYMAKAKHIGKIVVSLQDAEISRRQPARAKEPIAIRPDATYLVAGGLGGLGLAVARWLADAGARHLFLFGRSGASSEEARTTLATLRQEGVEVRVAQADVTSENDVRTVLDEVSHSMPPIHGIIHVAMVLDDAPLAEMSNFRMRQSLAPKVQGAWNLHRLTKEMPLDFFILFSSMSALLAPHCRATMPLPIPSSTLWLGIGAAAPCRR